MINDSDNFDERALTWDDDPAKVERAAVVAHAILATVHADSSTRMLEYGAGTGLVTQALREHVGPVTMADTSTGMRRVIEDKIATGTITDARVWNLDLSTEPAPVETFDLIVTVLTLHHILRVQPVLSGFAHMLADDGHLCIVDLDKEDGSFHHSDFAGHNGFDHSVLTAHLEAAGFTNIDVQPCHHMVRDGVNYPLFLAIARH